MIRLEAWRHVRFLFYALVPSARPYPTRSPPVLLFVTHTRPGEKSIAAGEEGPHAARAKYQRRGPGKCVDQISGCFIQTGLYFI